MWVWTLILHIEMSEVFGAFIALVFTGKVFSQSSHVPVLRVESRAVKYCLW